MKCLHVCNDLMGSKVHKNLYQNLKSLNLNQIIFYPLREQAIGKIDEFEEDTNYQLITSHLLNNTHRLFFRYKINSLYNNLKSQIAINSCNIVHATTLFSDGAIALKIWKEYKVPYILTVRGTDINLFLKYRYDLRALGKEIILNSKQLIFISNALEYNFNQNSYIKGLGQSFLPNSKIIPNGLDPYWIQNLVTKRNNTIPLNFLYIGKFVSNKNVIRLIEAFLKVSDKHKHIKLNLVGSGGKQEQAIRRISNKYKGTINFHGPIYDKKKLQKMYLDNDIFAMASFSETFGLVYVEALTQGLPILYTKNQGIDGSFKEYVGEAVNPKSINSIAEGMEKLISNYSEYEINKIDFSEFSWENIAKTYLELYTNVLNEKK